ncbi:phage tail protein [Selenomonadales bacterium OttesenSCG-928-I06]|nr:phage tail protein [Selenomonadales bacterium OttesenSCG-928-I06]
MPTWNGTILTTQGKDLQAKVEAGQQLILTKMKFGDGVLPVGSSLEDLTDLISPRVETNIISKEAISGGLCKITSIISNTDLSHGYYIRECGLYAEDPDVGEILYAIDTDAAPDYLPASGGATVIEEEFNLYIAISNNENVVIVVDPAAAITEEQMQAAIKASLDTHERLNRIRANVENVAVGDIRYPSLVSARSDILLVCTQAGITGTSEPSWGAAGSTITDGTAKFLVRNIIDSDTVDGKHASDFLAVNGIAQAANKLNTARKIELTGSITGEAMFNGSQDIMIDTTGQSSMPIGSIIFAVRTDVPEGCLRLDGAEYTRDTFPDFYDNFLVTGKLITCTYVQWNSESSANNGNVGKIGLDTTNQKFRMPRLADRTFVAQALTAGQFGKYNQDQIVNIIGTFSAVGLHDYAYTPTVSGALGISDTKTKRGSENTSGTNYDMVFDASKSVNTGDQVQPRHIQYPFFIVVFNAAVMASEAQFNQFIGSLENKANVDLSNISANIDYVIQTWTSGTSWYRKYKSGWVEQGGYSTQGGTAVTINLNTPFSNTNYTVAYAGGDSTSDNTLNIIDFSVRSKTNNSFVTGNDGSKYWYACGY